MFQTKVQIPSSALKIGYQDHVLALGSCFAENIGKRMSDAYFLIDVNPFGVLYNPLSIKNSLELLLHDKSFTSNDIFEYNSKWQSFSHSTQFSDPNSLVCLEQINSRLNASRSFFKQSETVIITFGTAWIFEDINTGQVVSNCHKLPARSFTRRRLTVQEIVDSYMMIIGKLHAFNPALQIIFSVSPIRHWKDGAHENNISKSTLLLAIDELQKEVEQVHYFPAYEIQMDELRDYRFYASDMLHPSDVAVDYIWEKFCETYFSNETQLLKTIVQQLNADLAHRPLHPEANEFLLFKKNIENKKSKIIADYPFLSDRIK
jgi:hypothetical protein